MDTAYANIGLDANTIWRDAPGDGFQKSSDKLWVKLNYLKEKKHHQVGEKGKVVTVHDVIPQSRLAVYGNYSYDNDREMMYNREKLLQFSEEAMMKSNGEAKEEPWMLAEVEQEFRRLTRNSSQPYDLYNGFKPIDCVEVDESIQKKYPVLAKKCQPHTVDAEETLETIYLPNPFYRIDDLNQLELQMRITSTKHIWEYPLRNLMPLLKNEKYCERLRCGPFSDNECIAERNNSMNANRTSVLPIPLPSAAVQSPPSQTPFVSSFRFVDCLGDLNVKRSLRNSWRTSQLTENKTHLLPVVKKRSSGDGHDFANLTLLTRPINRQETRVPEHSAFQVPETVLKWLHTGYPARAKEFSAIQNLSDELRNVRSSLQGSSSSNIFKERLEENIGAKQFEFSSGGNVSSNLDSVVNRGENSSTSPTTGSCLEPNRSKISSSATKLQISPVSNLTYSAVSSGGLPYSWQTQVSSLWTLWPFNLLNLGPSDLNFPPDYAFQKFAGKPGKCRPILNSQYKDVTDEDFVFAEGNEKKKFVRGMADTRIFQSYGENSFDDLERQAIEQWPSEDRMDIFCRKNVQ